MRKSVMLRRMFAEDKLIRVVGAHDGLSARLVERNGYDGVWASGLEISTSYAVPDAGILTMTQFLERAIEMNDATTIPVIADCDTGFGNSNNVIHMVKQYEAAGIAAVCIEDKMFPKVNSFIPGRQELATVAEFVGKIMAAKNAQLSEDFMVIARVEALIAGWGLDEALKRANAYREAGADAILIHSKASTPQEIIAFAEAWKNSAPLVIVPTTYSRFTVPEIKNIGIKMVIYANHGIRASVKAVNEVLAKIKDLGTSYSIEDRIAPMTEIFELQDMPRMKEQEASFLRSKEKIVAIIPAAGDHLEEYSMKSISADIPIAMLDINGKPLLQRQSEVLNQAGISDIYVITGYKRELIDLSGVKNIENRKYQETGILHSVMCAREHMTERTLLIYGDILFDESVLNALLKSNQDITLIVCNKADPDSYRKDRSIDFVLSDREPIKSRRKMQDISLGKVLKVGAAIPAHEAHYEFPGIVIFSKRGVAIFKEAYEDAKKKHSGKAFHTSTIFEKAGISDLLQDIINHGRDIHCLEIDSGWIEIHSMEDYKLASSIVK